MSDFPCCASYNRHLSDRAGHSAADGRTSQYGGVQQGALTVMPLPIHQTHVPTMPVCITAGAMPFTACTAQVAVAAGTPAGNTLNFECSRRGVCSKCQGIRPQALLLASFRCLRWTRCLACSASWLLVMHVCVGAGAVVDCRPCHGSVLLLLRLHQQ